MNTITTTELNQSAFAGALLHGLQAQPRRIAPKWFYDVRGSQLFDSICDQPEYYLPRVELGLLSQRAADIAQLVGPQAEIVEFGAGALRKAGVLIRALQRPAVFRPIDIAGDFMLQAAQKFQSAFPEVQVQPMVTDFTHDVQLPATSGPRFGLYLGSSIGNFDASDATQLLHSMRNTLAGGSLLVGVDLIKEPALLHAAYNDAGGVTASFNLNLLMRANSEAGANFSLHQWAHSAFYNAPERRIEMHLMSRRRQRVQIADQSIDFEEGDSMHTENSYKYTVDGFQSLARAAGWTPTAVWIDTQRWFSLHWLRA